MIQDADFSRYLMDEVCTRAEFVPTAEYDADGDCVEFLAMNEQFRAERVDDFVTVYYGRQTGELVGSMIKDVRRLLTRFPGFRGIEIRHGRVRLSTIFRASAWSTASNDEVIVVYEKLIEAADAQNAVIELEDCAA